MKKIIYTTTIFATLLTGCNFLDDNPQGIMTEKEAISKADELVTTAYSSLGNDTTMYLLVFGFTVMYVPMTLIKADKT